MGLESTLSSTLSFIQFNLVKVKCAVKTMNFTRAVTCDFHQCDILTSVDSDKPLQPPFKHRNSKWCSVNSLTIREYSSD